MNNHVDDWPTETRFLKAVLPVRVQEAPLHVKILVFDIATGNQIREHNVNWSKMMRDNDSKLKWFLGMIVWAAKNGKSVEIVNYLDAMKE